MSKIPREGRRSALLAALLAACAVAPAWGQAEGKGCALVLMHDRGGTAAPMAALGRKLQGTCTVRAVEMPWSQARANDKDLPGAWQELARHVRGLRQQGYTILMVEQNFRFAAPLADRFLVVEHGEVIQSFTQAELPARMERLHEYLGV